MQYSVQSTLCTSIVEEGIQKALDLDKPLYLPIIATKPCFIKMAGLINALRHSDIPFVVGNSNQHYDQLLTAQIEEFGYKDQIGINLGASGVDFNERVCNMAQSVKAFIDTMNAYPHRPAIIPLVSGDTFSAGILPQLFYFSTGIRSVHIEAGLRSLGPANKEVWREGDLLQQGQWEWCRYINEPFPEGMDTRLASVASELLLAPVKRNRENLLDEGYESENIVITGSLSSDAVGIMKKYTDTGFLQRYPFIGKGKWLRVDLHRRENLVPHRMLSVIKGLSMLSKAGMNVMLVKTNALIAAIRHFGLDEQFQQMETAGVVVCEMWPSYLDVISFMMSEHCLGLYTDSGGLQEEAHILGVPCLTLRYSTDRPETILDMPGNLLVPPISEDFIYNNVIRAFDAAIWRRQKDKDEELYGNNVGKSIVEYLNNYTPQHNAPKRVLAY